MLWSLPLVPIVGGGLLWAALARTGGVRLRVLAGVLGALVLLVLLGLAAWVAASAPAGAQLEWGNGLRLQLAAGGVVSLAALLVAVVSLPVVVWAAAHEEAAGLPRLVGLLVVFAGTMELLVLAADLLTLAVGWELVTALSWALIGHEWRDPDASSSAVYSFNVTRLGGLGLLLAAGAALATTGSFAYSALPRVTGGWRDLMVAGVLLAAASKAAQVPFSPWLFRAMAGPSSVSALLHSSTMVAAGAYLLVRLQEPLALAPWFGPAAIAIGLVTAWAGGFAAAVQPHAKRLLAASTCAQFGFVFVAVGAGSAGAGMAHIVTHAAFKSLLFLAAGTAMGAAGTAQLRDMRVGRALPAAAAASAVGALALAALPPLGGAWSKDLVVSAAGSRGAWLAVLTIAAGALSAWYAARFQLLAFGRRRTEAGAREPHSPRGAVLGAMWLLAGISLVLGVLWIPGVARGLERWLGARLPATDPWELGSSVVVVIATLVVAWIADRRGALAGSAAPSGARRWLAEWLGLTAAIERLVVAPTRRLASLCARLDRDGIDAGVDLVARFALGAARAARGADDRGVDAAVRGVATGLGRTGRQARRVQTGATPTYYVIAAVGLGVLVALLVLGR